MIKRGITCIILISALLLQGCLPGTAPDYNPADHYEGQEMIDTAALPLSASMPGRFTLRYDPSSTLNPITGRGRENLIVASLMYESLFVLGENFQPEPVLARIDLIESYSTDDNLIYTVNLRPYIAMSDGSMLTADDFAHSLELAIDRGREAGRLSIIDNVSSDGDLTVTIGLNRPYRNFINLLDFPVLKSGSRNGHVGLCASYFTEDNITYTINIRPGVAMNNGTTLTADDVAYSLRFAMQSGRFVNRLSVIDRVSSNGALTVTIVLNSPNSSFISLLDVPIIKSGSGGSRVPPGTGPYVYGGADSMRLSRFTGHRDFSRLPFRDVHLIASDDNSVTELFSDGELSLIWDDPSGTANIRLNRGSEPRFFDTTTLQFLGFNTRNVALRDPEVRCAIGIVVDREYISGVIMPGQTRPAPLALSPAYRLYDSAWENEGIDLHLVAEILSGSADENIESEWAAVTISPARLIELLRAMDEAEDTQLYMSELEHAGLDEDRLDRLLDVLSDPLVRMSSILYRAGLRDSDNDSFLDFPDGSGGFTAFSIDFIVNSENPYRVRAAHRIADTLRSVGFNIVVRELPWEEFEAALSEGDFDMYYGEAALGADFNLSPLLLPGGRLNPGGTGDALYREYIEAFLSAVTDEERAAAAERLVGTVRQYAPFIPILYKRHVIHTPLGAVTGALPSQSSVFRNIADWSVDFTMLT